MVRGARRDTPVEPTCGVGLCGRVEIRIETKIRTRCRSIKHDDHIKKPQFIRQIGPIYCVAILNVWGRPHRLAKSVAFGLQSQEELPRRLVVSLSPLYLLGDGVGILESALNRIMLENSV